MDKLNPYDQVFYPGYPFPQTHPDHLATLANLFGMEPAPVASCRVLELGCGNGANLISMAFGLPGSEFVGIDLAAYPVAQGKALLEELGLKNVRLRQCDVMDVSAEFGHFDYIIAHGLYSWIAAPARDKILMICKDNLAPQGVAYVSYNTYPGGHLRQMTREMMLYHLRNLADPQERLGQARGFIKSLSESQGKADSYKTFLEQEVERVLNRPDEALYHDDLAEINTPFYFYQFMEQAARHQLKYLTEARLADSQTSVFPASLNEAGNPLGDDIAAKEQYFDFLRCRMFRQTLLCHDDIEIDRSPRLDRMRKFYVASSARPVSAKPDIHAPGVIEQFRLSSGPVISIDHPLAKAALSHLGEVWPQSMALNRLISQARDLIGHDRSHDGSLMDQENSALCRVLLTIYEAELLELHTYQARIATVVSERPIVSPLARLQARDGTMVTTLRHTMVEVRDDLGRHLLTLLDGTRDREVLLKELALLAGSRHVTAQPAANISLDELELKLRELARLALFVA